MRKLNRFYLFLVAGIGMLIGGNSCTDDFEDINSNVSTIYEVEPQRLLYNVQTGTKSSSWEWYYDYYIAQMRWAQYGNRIIGNLPTTFTYSNNNMFEQRYRLCFLNAGSYARHLEYIVDNVISAEDRDKYSNAVEAARVTLIYQGITTSDTHGSLAYTEGWALRSGGTITEPKFETQKELYDVWDSELKNAIAKFKSNTGQISLAGYDMAYNGDIPKWIKAANGLRLRIALRLLQREPVKAKAIASEVLAESADIMGSIDDSFIFWLDGLYSNNGDYESVDGLIRASSSFMGYLNKFEDPRRRMFFRINNLTPENVAEWNAAALPAQQISTEYGRWVGGTSNYDLITDPVESAKYARNTLDPSDRAINMQPVNRPQTRIFTGFYDSGAGGTWFPNVTYADFCFMASEFVLEGVASSQSAEEWYTKGVRASLEQWNEVGDFCKIHDYMPMTASEMDDFMDQEGIKWDAAKGLEQIYVQSYVEHYKNSNEAWALIKRTGYPAADSEILALEETFVNGTKQDMPRRIRFSYPMEGTINYENMVERIDVMREDPGFGAPTDEFGRVWWDVE